MIDHLTSWASRRSISLWDQNPESARTVVGPVAPAASQVGDELVDESHHSSRRARGAFAHAGGEHFAGVGACGQQRVIAQHLGVAVRGAALCLPWTSQIVESRSTVSGLSPGPAPSPQARAQRAAPAPLRVGGRGRT